MRTGVRQGLCLLLIVLLSQISGVSAPVLAQASERASLSGRVLQADGLTPQSGVVVILFDPVTQAEYRAPQTGAEGAFQLASAPAGTYTVLVETAAGLFLAADNLQIEAGDNRPLALTLQKGVATEASGVAAQGSLPVWAKGLIIGIIAIAGLLVIDEITSDSEPCASPPCS